MDDRKKRIERFKQTRLEDLMTNEPVCKSCGETHFNVFEKHHIARRRYSDVIVLECKNCHAKLTALQKGHPPPTGGDPSLEEIIGRFLLGLADFFELLIATLRKFGEYLLEQARLAGNVSTTAQPGTAK